MQRPRNPLSRLAAPASSCLLLFWLLAFPAGAAERQTLSLAGQWHFEADPSDEGMSAGWRSRQPRGKTVLPTSENTKAGLSGNYTGPAWYQREINIPGNWKKKRVTLYLERPQVESRCWLDGRDLGVNLSAFTPHVYELGADLSPGRH
ncbi:MAG TPA: hypothetical protein VHH88_06020, partial [Verrucomicrobiae bacterium]|nr:hypothetical protein [Verrucomicrobiae bacterium]